MRKRTPTRGSSGHSRAPAFTTVELVVTVAILGTLAAGSAFTFHIVHRTTLETRLLSQLRLKAQAAMERLVDATRRATTVDSSFGLLAPEGGNGSRCLQFRCAIGTDGTTGEPVYDTRRTFLCGPSRGRFPSRGVVIGRGRSLEEVHRAGSGADRVLGTGDDDTASSLGRGEPAVELLIPGSFAPRAGDMFRVDVEPRPIGRLVRFELRLNVKDPGGQWVLDRDLVLSQRVALRQ